MSKAKPLLFLMLHCSATPENRNIRPEDIRRWHESRWGKGAIGYRTVITLDGQAHRMREANLDKWVQPEEMTWGAKGYNSVSHHICYIGGTDKFGNPKDTRTAAQEKTLLEVVQFYIEKINPEIKIIGHYATSLKACPSFNVPDWLRQHEIPEKNIYTKDPFKMGEWNRIFAQ